jgi:predicted transcriptional regulator|tara:strand:- start:2467 stop:2988 length:522 start_codon:yes stop_codon:yes gene_type:complete
MKQALLGSIFDKKTVAVVYTLLGKKGRFYLRDLSRESGVSLATAHRIIQKLVTTGMIKKDESDRIKFYEVDRSSDSFKMLGSMFMDKSKTPSEILKDRIGLMHGSEPRIFVDRKDQNKIIIVSALIDRDNLYDIIGFVNEELGTEINPVLFSNSQFLEMKKAGFFDSRKLEQI